MLPVGRGLLASTVLAGCVSSTESLPGTGPASEGAQGGADVGFTAGAGGMGTTGTSVAGGGGGASAASSGGTAAASVSGNGAGGVLTAGGASAAGTSSVGGNGGGGASAASRAGSGGTGGTTGVAGASSGGVAGLGGSGGSGEPQAPYEGYLFVYFKGEGSANGEQIYMALSDGNDPLSWTDLAGGAPVLTSSVGATGVRDPFILRTPSGDGFYLIATDLKIFGNGDWDAAQRSGSKSIVVWESADLTSWSEPRLVRVSPDTVGNTWAPEAFFDEASGTFIVFWASKVYAESDPAHTGSTYNRMLYATTTDFQSFSDANVWVDTGYSVIDSTIIEDGGVFYRFSKDERGNGAQSPCGKFVFVESSASLTNTTWDPITDCIGQGTINQGEGPLVFRSNTADKWYLFIDEFGGRGYTPFESTDLSTGTWQPSTPYSLPSSPRHGTVLPITAAEHERVSDAYGGG